jgi:hypothetical protein
MSGGANSTHTVLIMNPESDEIDAGNRRVCVRCVQEPYLKDIIETRGDEGGCTYCEWRGKTYSIADVADLVEKAFEQHYVHTAEDDYGNRGGEEVMYVVADAVGTSEEVAEDIRQVLDDRTASAPDEQWDEDPFSKEAYYARKEPDDILYQQEWNSFESSLKTEARFFSRTGFATLKNVFENLEDHRTGNGLPVIVVAGRKKRLRSLYRARVFQSDSKLKDAIMRPDKQIGPPGSEFASAGRMNARGISVFYGAKEAKTALAELRPPVGSDVVIGRFEIVKDVSLLDVGALAAIEPIGSIFDPTYINRLERAKFLSSLAHRITRPILPDDELSEYLVTQAIADFLATELKLDGVIYRSAQAKGGTNVALFHHATRVAPYEMPEGSTLEAHTYETDEDGPRRSFWIFEAVPATPSPQAPTTPSTDFDLSVWDIPDAPPPEPYLKLDLSSLVVREIQAVKYSWKEYEVDRSRIEKRSDSDF